jgi:hypothetical protein
MRAPTLLLPFLLVASAAVAAPVITSVTPSQGPVAGGTTVVIRGTGFSNSCVICSPPFADPAVYFKGSLATSVEFVDSTTLRAVTPPNVPGVVDVTVLEIYSSEPGESTLSNAFTYVGNVYEAFDPILFPIFSPPVHGQSGSEFVTAARLWNRGLNTVKVFGYDTTCTLFDPPIDPNVPMPISPRGSELRLFPECSQAPARLFYVAKGDASITGSLRVFELSRQADNHGVEIPVVRRSDFSEDSIALMSVPNYSKFRLTLRVYGLDNAPDFVDVSVLSGGGQLNSFHQVPLQHSSDPFVPSYAIFTDFPPVTTFDDELTILVETPRGPGGAIIPGSPIWAFLTITNNETQHITTITPHQQE